MDDEMRRFDPWKGPEYNTGIDGARFLILGESHYSTGAENRNLTVDLIRRTMSGDKELVFYRKVEALLLAALPDVFSWNRVAFYNYVQELVGSSARVRPSKSAWSRSMGSFLELIDEIEPDAVLVLGVANWNSLSRNLPASVSSLADPAGDHLRLWNVGGKYLNATWTAHPASFGFRSDAWSERIRELIGTAARRKTHQR